MRRRQPKRLYTLLLAGLAAPAVAVVEVDFTGPESYTDVGTRGYGAGDSSAVLDQLRAHLENLGARYLSAHQHLKVEILDVDLAGRFEPWQSYAYDIRFLREITWPRIKLRYTLTEGDVIVADAEEAVVDMMYLRHVNGYFHSDRLRYEKHMLDDWFRSRFGRGRTGAEARS